MIVDIHTHVFPDEIASRAIDSLIGDSHTRPFCDGTLAGLLKSRKQAGIDCCVVLPVATSPTPVLHMNDRAIQTNNLYRETGILSFGGMHPDTPDWKQELSRLARAGIKGIKLHHVFQRANLDDPRYLRIMERAAELGLVILTHAGVYIDRPNAAFCTPKMALQVFKELGDIPLILAHMGGWREIAERHGKSPAQVILRWELQRGVAVIPGSSNPEHIRENISVFDFALTADEMNAIAGLERNEKHDWY